MDSNRQREGGAVGKYTGKIIYPKGFFEIRIHIHANTHREGGLLWFWGYGQGIFDYKEELIHWYSPHVVFLMVGGNDLGNPNLSALDVASQIHDLTSFFVDSEGCYLMFVASITPRSSYPYLDSAYPQKVANCNKFLRALFEVEENMFYWTLWGLSNSSTDIMSW